MKTSRSVHDTEKDLSDNAIDCCIINLFVAVVIVAVILLFMNLSIIVRSD